MNEKKTYYVNYSVICRYTVEVKAENDEEAEELARKDFEVADFWDLEYGDSELDSIVEA